MASIPGKYILESSENFDEFMKKLGVGIVLRKIGQTATPTVEITETDGLYTIHTYTSMKSQKLEFKLGEEFDESTTDGRKVKSTFTMEDGNLVQIQKGVSGAKSAKFVREFTETHMNMKCECEGVISKRNYKRQ